MQTVHIVGEGGHRRIHPAWYAGIVAAVLVAMLLGGALFVAHRQSNADAGAEVAFLGSPSLSAQISFDASGIPTITADSYPAAIAGLGYAEASQRLFEMEEFTWTAKGTVSQYLGAGAGQANISSDSLFVTLDLSQQSAVTYSQADSLTKSVLTAFANGVNTYLQNHSLPAEFAALGIETLPAWTPVDSIEVLTFAAALLDTPSWITKIVASGLASVSPALAQSLVPVTPDAPSMLDAQGNLTPASVFLASNSFTGGPLSSAATAKTDAGPTTSVLGSLAWLSGLEHTMSASPLSRLGTILAKLNTAVPALTGIRSGPDSNNWVVAGKYTATGQAIEANDPHIPFLTPTFTYLVHLNWPGESVSGFTITGLPVLASYLASFSNGTKVSIGVTYVLADDDDVYLEKTRTAPGCTDSGEQVSIDGAWQCMTTRTASIAVAGGSPVKLTVLGDSHGPSINAAFDGALDSIGTLTLRMASADPSWSMDGWFSLPQDTSEMQLVHSIGKIGLSLSFTYAIGPNIGFHISGLIPARSSINGKGIVPGSDPTFDWHGFLPNDELPSVPFAEQAPYLNTANNRLVPDDYQPAGASAPVYITFEWDYAFRAQYVAGQLQQWINTGHKITVADMEALQLSTVSGSAQVVTPALLAVARRVGTTNATEQSDLEALAAWNGDLSATSHAAAVYKAWMAMLDLNLESPNTGGGSTYQVYADDVWIGTQEQASYLQVVQPTLMTLDQRDAWVMSSLTQAEKLLSTANATTWGDLHRLVYNHPCSIQGSPCFNPAYEIGPATGYPRPGDWSTDNDGGWQTHIGVLALPPDQLAAAGGAQVAFAQDAGPSCRVIWSLGNPAASVWVIATAEDGEPGSVTTIMPANWRNGIYVPVEQQ